MGKNRRKTFLATGNGKVGQSTKFDGVSHQKPFEPLLDPKRINRFSDAVSLV
jgi:hypothetical protein